MFDIHSLVQHADHLNAVRGPPIENHVLSDQDTVVPTPDFLPRHANHWSVGNSLKAPVELGEVLEPLSVPPGFPRESGYVLQILPGTRAEGEVTHSQRD